MSHLLLLPRRIPCELSMWALSSWRSLNGVASSEKGVCHSTSSQHPSISLPEGGAGSSCLRTIAGHVGTSNANTWQSNHLPASASVHRLSHPSTIPLSSSPSSSPPYSQIGQGMHSSTAAHVSSQARLCSTPKAESSSGRSLPTTLLPLHATARIPRAWTECDPSPSPLSIHGTGFQIRQYARKIVKLEEREAARIIAMARKAKRQAKRKKVARKVPAGVDVSPDSPLMKHYKKHLMGKQLVHRISKRSKVSELRDALLLYEKRTLGCSIAIAAMLTQLHRAKRFDRDYSDNREAVGMILGKLVGAMEAQLTATNLRIVATWLWASANLRLTEGEEAAMSPEMVEALLVRATQSERKLQLCSPRHLSLLTWSTSKLLTPEQLQNLPGAAAAISKLSRHTASCLHQFNPQGLANVATALSSLGVLDSGLGSAIAKESSKRIGDWAVQQFTARDYTGILGPLASLEDVAEHRPLFAQVAGHLSLPGALRTFRPQQLTQLSCTYATAGMKHDGMMEAIASAVLSRIGDFDGDSLRRVGDAFKTLDVSHPQLMDALQGA